MVNLVIMPHTLIIMPHCANGCSDPESKKPQGALA